MKKSEFGKVLKRKLKKWNIGDYVRQFSIVTGGVLLTLWLTQLASDHSRRNQIRQAMQLLTLELRDNLEIIRNYKQTYNEEKRVAFRLKERNFSLDGLPADTVGHYVRQITGGMGKPYRFRNDALEMFKTTGIASGIADKRIVIDLLRCYTEIETFDNFMTLYYDQRRTAVLPERTGDLWTADSDVYEVFGKMLAGKELQSWLGMIPRAFNTRYFEKREEALEAMISEMERRYR